MQNISRRDFLATAALGAAGLTLSARSWGQVQGANDAIRVAVIGFHGRGAGHIATLKGMKGVRIAALCDVDSKVLNKQLQALGGNLMAVADMRKIFERKEIDAVSIATPNHWHALATIWACQAGKDVYVEKPVSHNLFEGRQMVEAARKYGRIVQAGTQCRSSQGLKNAVAYVRKGELGKILVARGFCYKARKSIGLCGGPQQVPENIDYNLWTGPAPLVPPHRNSKANGPVHYDWHWFWNYGNGDFGNQAPHQVDICRWFLGEQSIAPFVMCAGGRLGYKDDAETPNTMINYLGYEKAPMIFEVRGLPVDKASQTQGWKMDNYKGAGIGCVIECENGYVVVPSYSKAIVYDKDGNKVREFTGKEVEDVATPGIAETSGGHHGNWLAAVRSRKVEQLNADVLEGHLSAGLVHTCNAAYRIGAPKSPAAIKEALSDNAKLAEAFERMATHLEKNEVDITKDQVTLGMPLKIDTKAERFVDSEQGNALLTRKYRAPFVVPEQV